MGKNPAQKSAAAKANGETKKDDKVVTRKAKTAKKTAKVVVAPSDRHCQIAKCKREYRAKGYCGVHYKKWKQGEYGLARYKTCKENECRKPLGMNRHGYCETHYQNYYVKGVEVPKAAPAEKPAEKTAEAG